MLNLLSHRKLTLKLLFVILLGSPIISCNAQSTQSAILSKKIRDLDTNANDIQQLVKSGYIKQLDAMMMGTYIVGHIQKDTTIKDWTIQQVLDSVKKQMNTMAIKENNYGGDSVFIRRPDDEKMFLGMGQMSLEKLIARESKNLPESYSGDYNLSLATKIGIEKASELLSQSDQSWLIGSILLISRDNGSIKKLKIGDVFEISKRVSVCPEFAPFMKSMDHAN